MTDPPEPEDTCRLVEVDGEIIRVHGAAEMTDEDRAAFAELVRAVKRRYEAEDTNPPAQPESVVDLVGHLKVAVERARQRRQAGETPTEQGETSA